MSTETATETANEKAATVSVDSAEVKAIQALTCKKHIKIYKLNKMGVANKDIAKILGTNNGAVHNALKDYTTNPDKVAKADAVTV